ncbi:MAG TPA: phage major capsid protein [Candidatus Dormibacteraeota bacterium]|jgi:HK97 family phage major capsid protein|nr:phage major capsid protein [Candidatus Dormibacteraeota bacterium]
MQINLEALTGYLAELNDLSNKPNHNPQEKRRFAFCQTAIAAIRSGVDVDEVDELYRTDMAKRGGVTLPAKPVSLLTREERIEAKAWKNFVEQRDMVEGSTVAQLGTYNALGFFVPTDFYPQLFRALKASDAVYDDDAVTVIKSTNGRPLPIPTANDTATVASVISEGSSESVVDIDSTGHQVLGAYTYRSPRFVASYEAFEDLEGTLSTVNLLREFSADRLQRGISKDLISGDGSGKPLGLANAIIAQGCPIVTASGSAVNDGSAATGANSLGSPDFAAAIRALDDSYAQSPKAAFFCNKKTLATLEALTDKVGQKLNLVNYDQGWPCIMGFRIRIAPSMDDIGPSKMPVILGDGRYWVTRLVVDENSGIRVYREAPGLIEAGKLAFRTFVRADGAMLWTDSSSPSPFIGIQNHS